MRLQPPRGTRDTMPREMIRREYVLEVARGVFERFGYSPMETPAFEYWELLAKKGAGGEDIRDEIYYFKDKSGRELGLRFDLTVPMARLVAANPQLPKPFKRYQIGRVWRYDRPQAGRWREFWQADVDVVGSQRVESDAECIAVAVEVLKSLGFRGFKVRLNSRKLLNGLVELAGVKKDRAGVFRALDKLEKVGEAGVVKELKGSGVDAVRAKKLMRMIKVKGAPSILKAQKKLGSAALDGIKELEEVVEAAKAFGVSKYIDIDFSLVRGLDYYTGPIFEVSAKTGKKSLGSVAGGGRYDELIELYGGRPTPAVGISLGIDRICELIGSREETKTKVFVVAVGDGFRKDAVKVAGELRAAGVSAQTDLMGRSLVKQLEYVNSAGIPYALFVGGKELKARKFRLRDMKSGKEKLLRIGELVKVVL